MLSQPLSSSRFEINNTLFYIDAENKNTVYITPSEIEIARTVDGKPKASLLKMRQVGDAITKTEDKFHYRNLLQFEILLSYPKNIDEELLKKHLGLDEIELKPIPISDIAVAVLVPNLESSQIDTIAGTTESQAQQQSRWSSKIITVELNNEEVQLVEHSLKSKNSVASFSYNIVAEMITYGGEKTMKFEGQDSLFLDQGHIDTTMIKNTILANSSFLKIDLNKYPEIITEADANASLPPNYPILEVRNYEFDQVKEVSHVVKKIEFRASGISGNVVPSQMSFYMHSPEIYMQMLRFNYPIDLKKPLQYRIVKVYEDRRPEKSDWKTIDNWAQMLDITEE